MAQDGKSDSESIRKETTRLKKRRSRRKRVSPRLSILAILKGFDVFLAEI